MRLLPRMKILQEDWNKCRRFVAAEDRVDLQKKKIGYKRGVGLQTERLVEL